MEKPNIHDRVRVTDPTHPRYGRTGTVSRILNGTGTPIDAIPEGHLERYPYWYAVDLDGDTGRKGHCRLTAQQIAVIGHDE